MLGAFDFKVPPSLGQALKKTCFTGTTIVGIQNMISNMVSSSRFY